MIKHFDFQDDAVDWLYNTATNPASKQIMVMRAPTGSGKTVMLIQFIDKYLNEADKNTAFVWLTPGKGDLEEQSRSSMQSIMPNRDTSDLFDVLSGGFKAGSTSFFNWERITAKTNKSISDSERNNLFNQIARAHRDNIKFIVIVDEEHLNATGKAQVIIDALAPQHIIRVSATPVKNKNAEYKEIDEQAVIDEGLITKAISVNEGVQDGDSQDDNYLLELADQKRIEIQEAYAEIGKNIRPLVLIQFPNGDAEKVESVEQMLETMGYTRKNKMVAAWLSGDKKDIPDNIAEEDSDLAFLFIKQAINTGWDCPRAKILVKLREGGSDSFQIQTIGRIRRMPEQKHYEIPCLDMCYVYTFDEDYKTDLLAGLDKAYLQKRLFLKEKCKSTELVKELRDLDGGDVDERQVYNEIRNHFVEKYSLTGNKKLNQSILQGRKYRFDKELLGSVISGVFVHSDDLENASSTVETRTPVNTHDHGIYMRHTIDSFKNILGVQAEFVRQVMDKLFSFKYSNRDKLLALNYRDYYAFIINNAHLIREELRDLDAKIAIQNRIIQPKTMPFRIPEEEFYHFDPASKSFEDYDSNAYEGYNAGFVTEDCGKSTPEIMFEQFCENHKDKIDWVYKNGDSGQQYLSIVYHVNIKKAQKLFYPDYILKMKNGDLWILETKGGQKGSHDNNIDKQIFNKFLTFKRYAEEQHIKWGFIRDMTGKLYLNNTEYVKDMHDSKWVSLEDALF